MVSQTLSGTYHSEMERKTRFTAGILINLGNGRAGFLRLLTSGQTEDGGKKP